MKFKNSRKLKSKAPLLTIIMVHLFITNELLANSPFYPVPAYLSPQANSSVKANVLLHLHSSPSMKSSPYINGGVRTSKLDLGKQAFTSLIKKHPNLVRWGLSIGASGEGTSDAGRKKFIPVDDNNAEKIIKQLYYLHPVYDRWITINYYQLSRYFQGLKWNSRWATLERLYPSPIQYRCQKNFIIFLADSISTRYIEGQTSDRIMQDDRIFRGSSRDGDALPEFTKKAFNGDFKIATDDGKDRDGRSWDDPAYPKQNIVTHFLAFGDMHAAQDEPILKQAAIDGGGIYMRVNNIDELTDHLDQIITSIREIVRASPPPAYTSDGEGKKTDAVAISFASKDWSSELYSYGLTAAGKIDLKNRVKATYNLGADRNIWYRSAASGNPVTRFTQNALSDVGTTFGITAANARSNFIPWLQGTNPENDQIRPPVPFGDVLNSDIATVNRGKMIVVGANDGMVHVFKKNSTAIGYKEIYAYIPSLAKRQNGKVLAKVMPDIIKNNYGASKNPHKYLVDGGSFYRGVESSNQHIVVGATGRGAAGVYALDMAQIDANNKGGDQHSVIFDITNSTSNDNNLGYTVGTPVVAKLKGTTGLVTLVSNGYFSKTISSNAEGRPALYAVNLETSKGGISQKWIASSASPDLKNGLSSPVVVDTDADGYADYAYAGDLKGDLYRFDLRAGVANSDKVVKIFSGNPLKPITSAPAVFKKGNKITVIFGTGKLLEEEDITSKGTQSVYGIIDDPAADVKQPVTEAELLEQVVTDSGSVRKITSKSLATKDKGWKFDLDSKSGERVVYQPVVWGDTLFLTSQIVSSNTVGCSASDGSGYLIVVDAQTGGVPKKRNAHLNKFDLTAGEVGSKLNGVPSKVGGLEPVNLNTAGANVYGQILPGIIPTLNPKDPNYIGGVYDKNSLEHGHIGISVGGGGELFDENAVTGQRAASKNVVRRLGWREVF